MIRHTLNISGYTYVADLYDANVDMVNEQHTKYFIMLREFTLINNVVCDNDIYFIDSEIFNEYINDIRNSKDEVSDKIVFPIPNSKSTGYSQHYMDYNSSYMTESLYRDNEDGFDIYRLYKIKNGKLSERAIKCNRLRIYHPHIKKNIKAVVEVENYINNIHFHYICTRLENHKTNSDTEFRIENNIYSEYIDLWIPSINDLFKVDEYGNYITYYKEDLNIVASTKNSEFINKILYNAKNITNYNFTSDIQLVPLNLLIQPFRIVEEVNPMTNEKQFVKLYIKQQVSIVNNYLTYPINITIFPYSKVDEMTNLYIIDDSLSPVAESFITECKFRLAAKMGFSNGKIAIINNFIYPNMDFYINNYSNNQLTSPVLEAYKYYNNINPNDYSILVSEKYKALYEDIDNKTKLSDYDKETVIKVANRGFSSDDEILKEWKRMQHELIEKEFEEEYDTSLNFIGFNVKIGTDINMKNIIFNNNITLKLEELDDFCFNLDGIFESWNQMPEHLIVQSRFIDRILGVEIPSNFIIITKEWFKYMINDCGLWRLSKLTYDNDNMKEIELKQDNINFINNINCIINKEDSSSKINGKVNNHNSKLVYRPIFYRTQELQNIKFRMNVTQNIGINLSQYMTKVETFKIVIENTEYVEVGRNDIYVIFSIPASKLNTNSGTYDIVNQDDEYISSGNWKIY